MFHGRTHHNDGFSGTAFNGFVRHGKASDLRVGGEILIGTVEPNGIVLKIKTQLLAHGRKLAGFAAKHGHKLLGRHRLHPAPAFLEFAEHEIQLRIRLLQVGHVHLASAGLGQLIDDLAPLDAAFMLTNDDAGAVRVFGRLFGVGDQGFGELFIGVLQIDDFHYGGVGKQ